jgi:hypothetical protein
MRPYITIIATLLLLSCNTNNIPIPDSFELNSPKINFVLPYEIKVYEIKGNDLNYSDFIKEKISCFSGKKTILWESPSNLQSNIRWHLYREIEFLSEGSQNFEELINLNNKLKTSDKIFFSGCYSLTKDIKGKSIPAFNYMYFLDIDNQKFYSFEFSR